MNICKSAIISKCDIYREDGCVVCPLHGLKWNVRTGELAGRRGLEERQA